MHEGLNGALQNTTFEAINSHSTTLPQNVPVADANTWPATAGDMRPQMGNL
jgi:hypothetical protein